MTKPHARPLDPRFRIRLHEAMRRGGFIKADGSTANTELAKKANCTHQAIGQYLSEARPRTSIDAKVLLSLCDALSLSPYWLLNGEGSIDDVELNKIPLQDARQKTAH